MTLELRRALGVELPKVVVLDIGAMNTGEKERYASLVAQGLAQVIGVEPQKDEFDKLQKQNDESRMYIPHVLGKGGKARFHVAQYRGCSSLYEPNGALIDMFQTISAGEGGNFTVVHTEEVETVPLDSLEGLPQPDLIKIDVQGAELDILEGGRGVVRRSLVIESEVEFVPIYKGQPLFCDIQSFLREQNFVFHKFLDMAGRNFRPLQTANPYQATSQLLWADGIFVRSFTRLSALSPTDLLKSALILNDVYHSYDLVLLMLIELDRRSGTTHSENYANALASADPEPMYLTVKQVP